jgi:uncharacterized protein (DUF305 family)
MKNHLRLSLHALAVSLVFASCGSSRGGSQGDGSGDDMQGMDHGGKAGQADGGMAGMGQSSGHTVSGMLMENGRYSDERFIAAMVPHHRGAVEMARVALENAEHDVIIQLSIRCTNLQRPEGSFLRHAR